VSDVVDVAWISAAAVVAGGLVAIAGQVASARIARAAAKATIAGDRDARLWERRAGAYVDAVREVLARRTRREALTSRGDIGNVGRHPIEEIQKAEQTEIIEIRSVLRAYASQDVWAAYEHADKANTAFWVSLTKLVSAHLVSEDRARQLQEGANVDHMPDPDYSGALDAMNRCRADAGTADDALFDAINRELGWRAAERRSPRFGRRAK
jgi:hypothetical protein